MIQPYIENYAATIDAERRRIIMKQTAVVLILAVTALAWMAGCASHGRHHDQSLPDPKSFNAHFGDMDTDGDESVSWEEFKAYFPEANRHVFEALDLNKDGGVDHDEWHEFKEAHGLGHVD
jgi:hypothetical protein